MGSFHERSALRMFLDHPPRGRELERHLDLLKATPAAHDPLADVIDFAIVFVFNAQVVIQIHATFDDLTAAITFDVECVISILWFGGWTAEEFFKEVHIVLSTADGWLKTILYRPRSLVYDHELRIFSI